MRYLVFVFLLLACHQGSRQQDDQLYSRHLQRHVKLTIISTPLPSNKSDLNLLLLNDGQEVATLRVKEVVDSLFSKHLIQPLVVVAIHAGDRMSEYGVAGKADYQGRGAKAQYYDAFIKDELYPFAKKKSGVRKFHSVAIAGVSLGGLAAFDIAWNHPEKVNKVGVFSGSFWWRDKDSNDSSYSDDRNRIIYAKIKASRKKPALQYWFYAGDSEESSDRDKDGVIDVIDDTRDMITLLQSKTLSPGENITFKEAHNAKHDWSYWSAALPDFLIWAFGR